MKKVINKILIICSIILLLASSNVFATDITGTKMQQQAEDFIQRGKNEVKITQEEVIEQLVPIGRILVSVATVVLVVVGMILGVKYMIAGADEKAKLKEKLIWYAISIIFIFGAVSIYTVVTNVLEGILN